jgi:hypothetical protein
MQVTEHIISIPARAGRDGLAAVGREVAKQLPRGSVPVRFAVVASDRETWQCEIGVVDGLDERRAQSLRSIFEVRRRRAENDSGFTTVLVVPTGVGSEIGGHAGDAMPVAALAAQVSDTLITHPNVVNGSDIMELPARWVCAGSGPTGCCRSSTVTSSSSTRTPRSTR